MKVRPFASSSSLAVVTTLSSSLCLLLLPMTITTTLAMRSDGSSTIPYYHINNRRRHCMQQHQYDTNNIFDNDKWRRRSGNRSSHHDISHLVNDVLINNCRGGSIEVPSDKALHSPTPVVINAHVDTNKSMHHSSDVINVGNKRKTKQQDESKVSEDNAFEQRLSETIHNNQSQSSSFAPRPRITIEFDTHAMGHSSNYQHQGKTSAIIRHRIQSRIGRDMNEWERSHNHGPSLSISLEAVPPPSRYSTTSLSPPPQVLSDNDNNTNLSNYRSGSQQQQQIATLLQNLIVPTQTTFKLLTQTITLLPPLLLSRRVLNTTWIAIVDYVRGRTFRTTFTSLERAYLRYYEFPAVTRALARLGSQITILLWLNWAVRLWMIWIMSNDVGPVVLGVTGFEIGMVGTSSGSDALFGAGFWKDVGLPCHQRGKGLAWLCGFIWIGAVVGIGHACAVALSVWGGPLRLQASVQHAENPKHVLRRIIHHPIKWIKELEEWKHLSALNKRPRTVRGDQSSGVSGDRVFNPDPLLFPATWLPLRWLQIFAIAKAFSTDPLQYRWCSPENDKIVIPRLMKQYLIQLALGDEWQRVFMGEKRVGLGMVVVLSYFVSLIWMVCTTFTLDGGAAAMLIPSVLAAIISGLFNIMIYWNRLGSRDQRKALTAMGLA